VLHLVALQVPVLVSLLRALTIITSAAQRESRLASSAAHRVVLGESFEALASYPCAQNMLVPLVLPFSTVLHLVALQVPVLVSLLRALTIITSAAQRESRLARKFHRTREAASPARHATMKCSSYAAPPLW
jgi:flagellar biosynthesis protein FliQ